MQDLGLLNSPVSLSIAKIKPVYSNLWERLGGWLQNGKNRYASEVLE